MRKKLLRNKIVELKKEKKKNDEFIRLFQEDNLAIDKRINEIKTELNDKRKSNS